MYHDTKGAWYFIRLPQEETEQIKFIVNPKQVGFGSLRVVATIGETSWQTSIFPDGKRGTYLLPIKAQVRKKEKLEAGSKVSVALEISL